MAETVGELLRLTALQKDFYATNGYLCLDSATSIDEISRVRRIIEDLMARRVGEVRGDRLDVVGTDEPGAEEKSPQMLMPCNYAPELTGRLHDDARAIAAELLGSEFAPEGEHVIMKPALTGPATPLHQDEAFWSAETDYCSLSIWFPLGDVTGESGCMRFVPGSHRRGIVPHHSVNDDPRNNGLEVCAAESFDVVHAPLPAGGATVHHCRTIHGAAANRSGQSRYAYILGFGLRAQRSMEERDFSWQKGRVLRREMQARAGGYELTKMHPEL